jgi:hypothetical protein
VSEIIGYAVKRVDKKIEFRIQNSE